MDKNYCVYCHTNKINGKKYIGITCQKPNKRWGIDGKKYHDSPKFWNAIQKYGWNNFNHEILFTHLSKDEACKKEIELIKLYNTNNRNFGYNISLGGDCPLITDETKEKIRQSKLGHYTSNDTKKKMSLAKIGSNHPSARKIICINTKSIYDTAIQAKNETGINDGNILLCCKGIIKSAGKMSDGTPIIWKYLDDYNSNEYYTYPINLSSKEIICLETNEKFSKEIDACKKYNISDRSINNNLKKRSTFAGRHPKTKMPLHWMYYDDFLNTSEEEIQQILNSTPLRYSSIICLNDSQIFESAKEALYHCDADNVKSITDCCKGKQKYVGFVNGKPAKWMYYKDYINMKKKEAV